MSILEDTTGCLMAMVASVATDAEPMAAAVDDDCKRDGKEWHTYERQRDGSWKCECGKVMDYHEESRGWTVRGGSVGR